MIESPAPRRPRLAWVRVRVSVRVRVRVRLLVLARHANERKREGWEPAQVRQAGRGGEGGVWVTARRMLRRCTLAIGRGIDTHGVCCVSGTHGVGCSIIYLSTAAVGRFVATH